jgi:hypothetical protein
MRLARWEEKGRSKEGRMGSKERFPDRKGQRQALIGRVEEIDSMSGDLMFTA